MKKTPQKYLDVHRSNDKLNRSPIYGIMKGTIKILKDIRSPIRLSWTKGKNIQKRK